jgi:hypothetical protein
VNLKWRSVEDPPDDQSELMLLRGGAYRPSVARFDDRFDDRTHWMPVDGLMEFPVAPPMPKPTKIQWHSVADYPPPLRERIMVWSIDGYALFLTVPLRPDLTHWAPIPLGPEQS